MLTLFFFFNLNVAHGALEFPVCAKYLTKKGYYSKGYKGQGVLLEGSEYGEPEGSSKYDDLFLLINWEDGDFTLFQIDHQNRPQTKVFTEYRDMDGRRWRVKQTPYVCY